MTTNLLRLSCFSLFVFLVLCSAAACAEDAWFYVAPDGENVATRDGSEEQPWATPSYACGRVRAKGATILLNAGAYRDDDTCVLAPGVSIQGAGREAVTIRSEHNDWYLLAESSPATDGRQTLSGFTLDGQKKKLAHGIRFKGRHHVVIRDLAVKDVDSFGIQVFGVETTDKTTPPKYYVKGIEVSDCHISNCGKLMDGGEWSTTCLSIGQLDAALIHDLVIREPIGTGIAFWENGWFKGTKIYNCDISVTGLNPKWDSEIAIELWNLMDDCEVYNNKSDNWFSFVGGNKGMGQHSVRVHDNVIVFPRRDNPKEGIEVGFGLSDAEISGNDIRNSHFGVALWGDEQGWDISNVSIHHNVFYNDDDQYTFGVFINPSASETYAHIHVDNNVFDGVDEGVQILNSNGGKVLDTRVRNNVFMNTPHGVLTVGRKIERTVVRNNVYTGDHVFFESEGSTLETKVSDNKRAVPAIKQSGQRPHPYYSPSNKTSNLIDAGVDVGFSFTGPAPDIGAFEEVSR